MLSTQRLLAVLTVLLGLLLLAGCSEDDAEDALEEATGYDWELTEEQFEDDQGVDTPFGWNFIFAIKLEDGDEEMMDKDLELDLSLLEELGFEMGDYDNQIIFAHVASTGSGNGLRYANKMLFRNGKIMLDTEAVEAMGDSIGSSGPGWYVAYHSEEAVGYVTGSVLNCDGEAPANANEILVLASDGPFFTFAAKNGSYALPSLDGKPASVNFDAGDCTGSDTAAITDEENGKDPDTSTDPDVLEDETLVVQAGETNLQFEGPEQPEEPPAGDVFERYEFDDGEDAWTFTSNCFGIIGEDVDVYDLLFPDGEDDGFFFGFLSTGAQGVANKTTCTLSRTFNVPADATKMVVAYDFISQEYKEWTPSAYNDIFTVIIQGEYDYVVHRTVNAVESDGYWEQVPADLAQFGWIVDSPDAQFNKETGAEGNGQFSQGAYMWDGHLKYTEVAANTGRGNDDNYEVKGQTAEYPVTGGSTITVLFTVSDVADAIYDSAAAIDYIEFQ